VAREVTMPRMGGNDLPKMKTARFAAARSPGGDVGIEPQTSRVQVDRTGAPIVVTKRGRAVAQLGPVRTRVRSAFGLLKGRIVVRGNIVDPIDVIWNANK
jgi:antitoxin (DNA-binding transcriptional repressor) of toxin-antitoxin stability system